MAKINCPSCGASIEIPAEFVQELKDALAGSDTDAKTMLAELKALLEAQRQPPAPAPPAPTPPAPEPPAPEPAPAERRHGLFYDEH